MFSPRAAPGQHPARSGAAGVANCAVTKMATCTSAIAAREENRQAQESSCLSAGRRSGNDSGQAATCRLAPAIPPAAAPPPAPPASPAPAATPPSGSGRSGSRQRQSGNSDRCGDLGADAPHGVRREHRDDSQRTNHDNPGLREDIFRHCVHLLVHLCIFTLTSTPTSKLVRLFHTVNPANKHRNTQILNLNKSTGNMLTDLTGNQRS